MDPLDAVLRLKDDYVRYLQTIYAFRDPRLRDAFADALRQQDFLVKGPILQAARPFEQAESIANLVSEGTLRAEFRQLCSRALPFDRPLYRHQVDAVRKIVKGNRNVVVATGTGSGKTEAFLIPIIQHLLAERAAGTLRQPGVRALLLYPMNALANDQLRRLRRILQGFPEITFGRYTGETPDSASEGESRFVQQFPEDLRLPNELLCRDAIRSAPPHLLLTNYSMLEFLLLRPIDSELFDGETGRHWRFVVLDEAHVYDGAAGTEVAMLLRRLKDRVVQSEPGRLQVIATSATLGRGQDDYPAVAEFASALLGEPVQWDPADKTQQDVVGASYAAWEAPTESWGPGTPELYAALVRAVRETHGLSELADLSASHGVPQTVLAGVLEQASRAPDPVACFLYHLLRGDERLDLLRRALETPQYLSALPEQMPGTGDTPSTLVDLVALAVRARQRPDDTSLLPARYHTFIRALEGAFLCLNTEHPSHAAEGKPRLFLSRHERCPTCDALVFELASCPRCGATYIVGRETRGGGGEEPYEMLHPAGDPGGELAADVRYFVWEGGGEVADEDEAAVEGDDSALDVAVAIDEVEICLTCGAYGPVGKTTCSCRGATARLRTVKQKGGRLSRCVSCGATRGGHPVYRLITGKDAPVAVLATSLYQLQSDSADPAIAELPGGGRKLLSFGDSRQDAAFFAAYLSRTYHQIVRRALIYAVLRDEPESTGGLRLQDLVGRVVSRANNAGFFTDAQSPDERRRLVSTWLTQEFAPTDSRISLEGTGLLHIRPVQPTGWSPPPPLLAAPWSLTIEEAWTLVTVLLDSMRQQGVIAPPPGVELTDSLFRPRNLALYANLIANVKKHVIGWQASDRRYSNRRIDYLSRVLAKRSGMRPEDALGTAEHTLRHLWTTFNTLPLRDFLATESVRGIGQVCRLDTRYWEWGVCGHDTALYRCSRCGVVCHHSLNAVCPTNHCDGTLELFDASGDALSSNHYRHSYQQLALIPLEAQEHTAQWRAEKAAEIQSQFIRGQVNVLSCSTTFELGVDVGDLDMVLMRNVPPSTANYVQRAGRAGRRASSVPFVVTYCQRRSHDLYHFRNPVELVAGHMRPPYIELDNQVIARRHVYAVAYASFLRDLHRKTGHWPNRVSDMIPATGPSSLANRWRAHLRLRPADVEGALNRILPETLRPALGISDWGWVAELTNSDSSGILDLAEAEIGTDDEVYSSLIDQAVRERKFWQAKSYQQVADTVKGRELLGFLASRNILPKYGFPTDVVSLRTSHIDRPEARDLELERDLALAISEYAPGSELVAGGRLWRGGGIYRLPGKEWPAYHYAVCPECGRFESGIEPLDHACRVCGADLHRGRSQHGTYIIPLFGFVADRKVDEPGQTPPERTHASRVFFGSYTNERAGSDLLIERDSPNPLFAVAARYSRFGQLHVVNSGVGNAGFRMCDKCGWATPATYGKNRLSSHTNPITERPCSGVVRTAHLGHSFITDVLELRLTGPGASVSDKGLWWSVLFAVVQGTCDELQIPRDDIGGTLYRYAGEHPPALMLYDSVPGGAGHLRKVADALDDVLRAAYSRVANCECGPETSCYQCLRDYYNQYYHDQLKRGPAARFLGELLGLREGQD